MKTRARCVAILICFLCQGIWTEAMADTSWFACWSRCRKCVNFHRVGAIARCSQCQGTDTNRACGIFLNCHLKHRGDHCDGYDGFYWNWRLASEAQQWASKCTRGAKTATNPTGFAHCSSVTPNQCDGAGENLAVFWGTVPTPKQVVDLWYDEVKYMELGNRGYKEPQNGQVNGHTVGHFTQMVWWSSKALGCGEATCSDPEHGQVTLFVCRYSPQGNIAGQYGPPVNNVAPPQCLSSVGDQLCPR